MCVAQHYNFRYCNYYKILKFIDFELFYFFINLNVVSFHQDFKTFNYGFYLFQYQ